MRKSVLIGIIVAVLVLAIAAYFVLAVPGPSAALLYVERGDVQVKTGNDWQPATDEMQLAQGDAIKTGDGEATIVILEGEILRLGPDSEITLERIGTSITIKQIAGETLHKVTRLSGMTDYTVQTASTVATVRGTEFLLNDEEVAVTEGDVDYTHDNTLLNVMAGKQSRWRTGALDDIDDARHQRLRQFRQQQIDTLKRVRIHELRKHTLLLKLAEQRGMDEPTLRQKLQDIDDGKEDEDALLQQAPSIARNKLQRAHALTKTIKRLQTDR